MDLRHRYSQGPTSGHEQGRCLEIIKLMLRMLDCFREGNWWWWGGWWWWLDKPVPRGTMAQGGLLHCESWPTLSRHCRTQPTWSWTPWEPDNKWPAGQVKRETEWEYQGNIMKYTFHGTKETNKQRVLFTVPSPPQTRILYFSILRKTCSPTKRF